MQRSFKPRGVGSTPTGATKFSLLGVFSPIGENDVLGDSSVVERLVEAQRDPWFDPTSPNQFAGG